MKFLTTCCVVLLLHGFGSSSTASAQSIYFPPNVGTWDTLSPSALGWCTDSIAPLLDFLDQSNTKAFLVLKDGRIVIEEYFGTFTQDSLWYWASAGKSVTAFLVGKAQEEGFLSITDSTSKYLGQGWTNTTPAQEGQITVRDQLSMTTGLDDGGPDVDCTDPICLNYLADPGMRWAYHNAPYTLLDGVIANATGQGLNAYLFNKLSLPIGMYGTYLQLGYNNVLFSKPRAMARFGLMMMAGGTWNGTPVMNDPAYFNAMITPSQALNESYGYLWWLNGQPSYMLPGLQWVIPGMLMPNAPPDAYNAMGKNGQVINISPSTGLVVVRMGDLPGGIFVPNVYNDEIWQHLNAVMCLSTGVEAGSPEPAIRLHPNPVQDMLTVTLPKGSTEGHLRIVDASGRVTYAGPVQASSLRLDLGGMAPGSYRCVLTTASGRMVAGFVKE